MSSTRKLITHFGHFFSASTITLLVGLVTFPLLTRLLTKEEYGILGLVTNTIAFAVALSKGGLSDGIIRFYREYEDTPERLSVFTSTVVTRGVLLSAFWVVLYLVSVPMLPLALGVEDRFVTCFLIMAIYLAVRPLNIIVLNYFRVLGMTKAFGLTNILTRVVGVVIAFTLLLNIVKDLYGYFLGIALAEIVATVFLFRWLLTTYRYSPRQVSNSLAISLFKFGLPLLLTELAYLLLTFVDRFMIVAINGEEALGSYSVGYTLASYINELVMFSLAYAVVPIYTDLFVKEGRQATETFLAKALHYYLMLMIPLEVGYAAVAKDLITLFASAKYSDSAAFSPVVLAGLIFLGMNSILYAGLYLMKKSRQMLVVMLVAVVVNVVINALLLPNYGPMGAALATLVACAASSVLMAILGRRYVCVAIPVVPVLYYGLVSVVMYLLLAQIETGHSLTNLLVKVPMGALLVGISIWIREPEMRAHGIQVLTKLRK